MCYNLSGGNMEKRDYKNIFILLGIALGSILLIFISGNIFGSNMDFINQHAVLPEYFREYFYTNHKLIPEIFYNLGAGENAFNFSYYGLLSPVILISYLLPFISMRNYIMGSSIIMLLISIFLFYKWIRNSFDSKYTCLLTLIFMLASPIFFHFHRQLMFVNYLPFLLLTFINIDKDNKFMIVINVFLMIMTSYYFSVVGIVGVIIYYLYKNFNNSFKEKIKIFIPVFIAIALSGILLIPTIDSILANRMTTNTNLNILELFIPNFNYSSVLYSSYALGLFSIAIISLIWLLLKNDKKTKFLSICLLTIITLPIFRYLFNGGLYIRSKVLIPLLPLFILGLGLFLKDLFDNNVSLKKLSIGVIIALIFSLFNFSLVYVIDLSLTLILILIYSKIKCKKIIYIPLILLFITSFIYTNINENYLTIKEYNGLNKSNETIEKTLTDSDFYRLSDLTNTLYNVNYGDYYKTSIYSSTVNNNYSNFYYDILNMNNNNYNNLIIRNTDNIIFNRLMSVKYVYSNKKLGNGYKEIGHNIYENVLALPLGYASSSIYSLEQFSNLDYPYNLKYLLNGIVADNSNGDTENIVEKIEIPIPSYLGDFININNNKINVEEDSSFTINLGKNLTNKLLIITIEGLESNSCKLGDIGITINGVENTLNCKTWLYNNNNTTFNFVINENDLRYLDVAIKKGEYNISDIKTYTIDMKYLETAFDQMGNITISDNKVTGDINITEDGYMTISIPYDKNFHIYVDSKEVEYEKVNTVFLGFKINKGYHQIEVVYKNKMIMIGRITSIGGLLSLVIYLLLTKKKCVKVI